MPKRTEIIATILKPLNSVLSLNPCAPQRLQSRPEQLVHWHCEGSHLAKQTICGILPALYVYIYIHIHA